jgi:hypothetical protein
VQQLQPFRSQVHAERAHAGEIAARPAQACDKSEFEVGSEFGYGLNYLIDVEYAVIVDVEATPAPP